MPSAKKAASTAKKAATSPAAKGGDVAEQDETPAKATKPAAKAAKQPAAATKAAKTTAKAAKKPAKASSKAAAEPEQDPSGSPFPASFLAQQREALLDERATYLRQAESLRAEAEALVADFEPGDVQFDEESGEGDTISVERERDLALSASARAILEEIDRALAKLDNGTYGICEVSGLPIPKERLEAIPWARERVEYKIGGLGRH
jgi:RNA polymerase-binding transcription factor DksA